MEIFITNFLNLLHSYFVKTTKSLQGDGEEHKPLLLAGFSCSLHLALKSVQLLLWKF